MGFYHGFLPWFTACKPLKPLAFSPVKAWHFVVQDSILELVGSISSAAQGAGFCLSYADFKDDVTGSGLRICLVYLYYIYLCMYIYILCLLYLHKYIYVLCLWNHSILDVYGISCIVYHTHIIPWCMLSYNIYHIMYFSMLIVTVYNYVYIYIYTHIFRENLFTHFKCWKKKQYGRQGAGICIYVEKGADMKCQGTETATEMAVEPVAIGARG